MNTTKPASEQPTCKRAWSHPLISPLARAALENGVAFEDVAAYAQHDARQTAARYLDLEWEILAGAE